MDSIDRRLLASLQRDNLQTAERLAEQVHLSPSAIARRLRALRASGAIAADVSVLSEMVLGGLLSAVVHVQLERHIPHETAELRRRLAASPSVQLYFDVAGPFDLMLLVVVRDMDEYNAFAAEFLETAAVRRFETAMVKKRHKATLAAPID